jgi:hypothetical protein
MTKTAFTTRTTRCLVFIEGAREQAQINKLIYKMYSRFWKKTTRETSLENDINFGETL